MSAKAVVFAYHDIGCAGIEALLDSGYEIAAVFTHADDPGENTFYASVAQLCARKGIAVHAQEARAQALNSCRQPLRPRPALPRDRSA